LNAAVAVVADVTFTVQLAPLMLVQFVHDENTPLTDADAASVTEVP